MEKEGIIEMVPVTKKDLRILVSQTTIETYEELTPKLIQLIDMTKKNPDLTDAQKSDEISHAWLCQILHQRDYH